MIAVANRAGGYDVEQQEMLESLAPAVIGAFDRKQAEKALIASEEAIRHSHAQLEQRVNERTEELKASKEFLAAVVEAQAVSVCACKAVRDEYGKIVDLQYTFANAVGKTLTGGLELEGLRYTSVFPDSEHQAMLDAFREVIETGWTLDREFTYKDTDRDRWFRCVAVKWGDGIVLNTEDITARKHAQQELIRTKDELAQIATDKYLRLFNSIDEGFCVIELLFDEAGCAVDYRFLELNAAFERQSGLPGCLGRCVRELVPDLDQVWFDLYGRVALTGQPLRVQDESRALGRCWDVYAFRVGEPQQRRVAVLFNDVTDRKKREDELRATNEELLRFNRAAVDRELRMIELKREVDELRTAAGLPARYSTELPPPVDAETSPNRPAEGRST